MEAAENIVRCFNGLGNPHVLVNMGSEFLHLCNLSTIGDSMKEQC